MMEATLVRFRYPRRRTIRAILSKLSRWAFELLADIEIVGAENLPKDGPLIVVANHFFSVDPALMIGIAPWPMEFLGAQHVVAGPRWLRLFPLMWGIINVARGSVSSRLTLRAAEAILQQNGVLGIYPEAGAWSRILRPPRPGTAYIAARSGARLLPIGMDGVPTIFQALGRGKRAKITVRIGKPFGPFEVTGRGRQRREQLEAVGHEIMQHIAELLPEESRGYYGSDPAMRERALAEAEYPDEALDG
jgi:1-acyl-sn-glycerol-3-phosphate acyltransferase